MLQKPIDIEKSSRHQKIIGNLGEQLVCNWLSRSGFEVAVVDHTGIDLIAYDPRTRRRIGITVKSRTRNPGKEKTSVNLISNRKGEDDRKKVTSACETFNCEPWIAVYVETTEYADLFLTSLDNYDTNYRISEKKVIDNWKMSPSWFKRYDEDPEVKHLHLKFEATSWFTAETSTE